MNDKLVPELKGLLSKLDSGGWERFTMEIMHQYEEADRVVNRVERHLNPNQMNALLALLLELSTVHRFCEVQQWESKQPAGASSTSYVRYGLVESLKKVIEHTTELQRTTRIS